MNLTRDDLERFDSKVYRTDYCWHWIANKNTDGYGSFNVDSGNRTDSGARKLITRAAHRVSFFIHNGRNPNGILLHSCDNPGCVRPEHLSEGTNASNSADAKSKGRTAGTADWQRTKTHCPQGHPYSGENLYTSPSRPERHCRICKKAAWTRWHERQKGESDDSK